MAAVAILSYVLPVLVGGNGYLSAYIAGIILGNAKIPNKKTRCCFRRRDQLYAADGVLPAGTALYTVPAGQCDPAALAIAVVLTFVVRPLVVALLLTPFPFKASQQLAGLLGQDCVAQLRQSLR